MKPHPLENMIKLKVQTVEEKHPVEVLLTNVQKLKSFNENMKE